MAEYVKKEDVVDVLRNLWHTKHNGNPVYSAEIDRAITDVYELEPEDVAPVRHGRWLLEANKEKVNFRWNVTAECSNCCDEKKEIWGGFFPNVPDWLARDTALIDAKSVKLSNYCPNCGARMDGGDEDG